MGQVSDSLWYKDAVIYELHVKTFFDASGDGVGDFAGLTGRLDYLADLGVTALWLLPFYPSPLRDDGYDISDYRAVNPVYGSLRDFKTFIRAAHDRGLHVITELVINHTSDQHPWFRRARSAPRGSRLRDYYVWSDDDRRWADSRVIFKDSEVSNWTWDPVAGQYYWHRFYSHQPDLNYDNPRVLSAVTGIMRHWLDLGVDGLRLDAIPYLVERDGTGNENLPETHAVIRRLRAALAESHPDAFFLAEANQWPEDAAAYFGEGDECHMCFHFPLMPRMYMAIAQEDRHPISDILRQTPEIPESCQWAIFLRNHDELTLEMVTDRERDYLWEFYAADKRARLNLGIRRRLAPLMGNDPRKIKLLNSLLFSMPGTPIVFYGDEIGMGDNVFLGDRDGVRTPMQWSPDRNGGFSRADPARLYLPVIADPVYGFQAVNVEAQQSNAASLLNWMRQTMAVRRRHRAFGRGGFTLLSPRNRKILAYLRRYQDETVLCVANLSRSAQAVELDLAGFKGRVPVELIGHSSFPPIGELPYLLTLSGYCFFWFLLAEAGALPSWHEVLPEPMPELATLVLREGWSGFLAGRAVAEFERTVLPAFLVRQRWFAGKDARIRSVRVVELGTLKVPEGDWLILIIRVGFDGDHPEQLYALPLMARWDESLVQGGSPLLPYVLCKIRRGARVGALLDASGDEAFPRALAQAIDRNANEPTTGGRFEFRPGSQWAAWRPAAGDPVRGLGVDQSNTSRVVGDRLMIKLYRRLVPGLHPELEMGRFLTDVAGFANTPPTLGSLEAVAGDGTRTALAVIQGFVANQGNGWTYTLDFLRRELGEMRLGVEGALVTPEERFEAYRPLAVALGRRTAALHRALAQETGDPAFDPASFTVEDAGQLREAVRQGAKRAFAVLAAVLAAGLDGFGEPLRAAVQDLLAAGKRWWSGLEGPVDPWPALVKTRIHGDFHLGQVLVSHGDVLIVDFEGEPLRSLDERRARTTPVRDLAGMVRSFDYAAWSAASLLSENDPGGQQPLLALALRWRDLTAAAFLESYREAAAGCPSVPEDAATFDRLLDLLMLDKAFYEIAYEAAQRPACLAIPVRGALAILERAWPPPP